MKNKLYLSIYATGKGRNCMPKQLLWWNGRVYDIECDPFSELVTIAGYPATRYKVKICGISRFLYKDAGGWFFLNSEDSPRWRDVMEKPWLR